MGPWSVVRWVRAASFAGTCAGLAALGHLFGGGSLDPAATLAGFLIILVPALALTGRERTRASILPATALSQVVLHLLLTAAHGTRGEAPTVPAAPMGGAGSMEGMDHGGGAPGLTMLLMHAVSVLVTSAWLEWGEARLCALVRHLAGWVLRPLVFLMYLAAGRSPAGPRPVARSRGDERAPVQAVLRHVVVRRGPPGAWNVPGTAA